MYSDRVYVPNLLEEVSVVGVEAHDEVGIGEKVVSDKISGQLAINVLLWVGFSDLDGTSPTIS